MQDKVQDINDPPCPAVAIIKWMNRFKLIMHYCHLYQKRAREYCSAETILGFRTVVGFPFVAALAYFLEPTVSYEAFMSALPYIFLIATGIYVAAKIMWIEALNRISITKLSAMLALMPLFTLIFAYLYLGEVPELRQMMGILPVLVGGYLITKPV